MGTNPSYGLDMETAKTMTDSFAVSSGVRCRLLSPSGDVLYQQGAPEDECAYLKGLPGEPPQCEGLHCYGLSQAERFGGRYIYSCPSGLTYCACPIFIGQLLVGGLVAGPVLLMETDDLLDDILEQRQVPGEESEVLREFLLEVPSVDPAKMRHLAVQLFASAVCVGDATREMVRLQSGGQQRSIGQYVHQVKNGRAEPRYPIEKEFAMSYAVSKGDRTTAAALLNELLGYIFFFISDLEVIQTRVTELLLVLSRACISGGGNAGVVLDISHQHLKELRLMRTQEDVAQWLARVLGRFTDLVFDLVDSKHANSIRKAKGYIHLNYERDITLSEVADYVGYSSSHFSKIFKEETGCSFRTYLNRLRVEKSKSLLLDTEASIAEICTACGFVDQSYFGKVFKNIAGVTPDKYRKQIRRIDSKREYVV